MRQRKIYIMLGRDKQKPSTPLTIMRRLIPDERESDKEGTMDVESVERIPTSQYKCSETAMSAVRTAQKPAKYVVRLAEIIDENQLSFTNFLDDFGDEHNVMRQQFHEHDEQLRNMENTVQMAMQNSAEAINTARKQEELMQKQLNTDDVRKIYRDCREEDRCCRSLRISGAHNLRRYCPLGGEGLTDSQLVEAVVGKSFQGLRAAIDVYQLGVRTNAHDGNGSPGATVHIVEFATRRAKQKAAGDLITFLRNVRARDVKVEDVYPKSQEIRAHGLMLQGKEMRRRLGPRFRFKLQLDYNDTVQLFASTRPGEKMGRVTKVSVSEKEARDSWEVHKQQKQLQKTAETRRTARFALNQPQRQEQQETGLAANISAEIEQVVSDNTDVPPSTPPLDSAEKKRRKKIRQREERSWVQNRLKGERSKQEECISISNAVAMSIEAGCSGQPDNNGEYSNEVHDTEINHLLAEKRAESNRQQQERENPSSGENELPCNDSGPWLTEEGDMGESGQQETTQETPVRRTDRQAGRIPPRRSQRQRRENGNTVISPLSPLLDTGFSDGTPRFSFNSQPAEYNRPVRPHTPVVNVGQVRTPPYQYQEEQYPPVGTPPSPVFYRLLTR